MLKRIKISIFIVFSNSLCAQNLESVSLRSGFTIASQKWHYKSINMTLDKDILIGL